MQKKQEVGKAKLKLVYSNQPNDNGWVSNAYFEIVGGKDSLPKTWLELVEDTKKIGGKTFKNVIRGVGVSRNIQDLIGKEVEVAGVFNENAQYGNSLRFFTLAQEGARLQFYLMSILGMNTDKAIKLLAEHGDTKIAEVLDEIASSNDYLKNEEKLKEVGLLPKREATEIEEIERDTKRAILLKNTWNEYKSGDMEGIGGLLLPFGLTKNRVASIINTFKEEIEELGEHTVISRILSRPYQELTKVRGIGFKAADSIAQKMNIPLDSEVRLNGAIEYYIKEHCQEQGHTVLELDTVLESIMDGLGEDFIEFIYTKNGGQGNPHVALTNTSLRAVVFNDAKETVLKRLREMVISEFNLIKGLEEMETNEFFAKIFYKFPFVYYQKKDENGKLINMITTSEFYMAELGSLSQMIERINSDKEPLMSESDLSKFISDFEAEQGWDFDATQRKAIEMANVSHSFILAGYAGSGKSTISRAILDLIATKYTGKEDILTVAVAGKAVNRIRETTGRNAMTIAKYLSSFNNMESVPSVLLIDEASMLDSQTFGKLSDSLGSNGRIILVGDPGQLPAINPGTPFRDLIESDLIPKIILGENHRSNSVGGKDIGLELASAIREERLSSFNYKLDLPEQGYTYKSVGNKASGGEEAIENRVRELLNDVQPSIEALIQKRDYRGLMDTIPVIISPMKGGISGVNHLNAVSGGLLNPNNQRHSYGSAFRREDSTGEETEENLLFAECDKVMQVVNMNLDEYQQIGNGVFTKIGNKKTMVSNGESGIIAHINPATLEMFVTYNGGNTFVKYNFKNESEKNKNCVKNNITQGWATTGHKSQGSEFSTVIMIAGSKHTHMLDISILYTIATRKIDNLHIIANDYAFREAAKKNNSKRRETNINTVLANRARLKMLERARLEGTSPDLYDGNGAWLEKEYKSRASSPKIAL